jgi:hypothetical protein
VSILSTMHCFPVTFFSVPFFPMTSITCENLPNYSGKMQCIVFLTNNDRTARNFLSFKR